MGLPKVDSESLVLVNLSPEEVHPVWMENGASWARPLSINEYIDRETCLANQDLTREGGIQFWALADNNGRPGRRLLSTFESLRKRALLSIDGKIEEGVAYGIGSVWCMPQHRGNKYANRMLLDFANRLKAVNLGSTDSVVQKSLFSALWSDIGKKYYVNLGWHPYPASHIKLQPLPRGSLEHASQKLKPLHDADLRELCAVDEKRIRTAMAQPDGKVKFTILPDYVTMRWHHAREDFLNERLLHRDFEIKGAIATNSSGQSSWCIWTRVFDQNLDEKGIPHGELIILRLVYDKDQADVQEQLELLFKAAQMEAHACLLGSVQAWNPDDLVLRAAQAAAGKGLGKPVPLEEILIHREDSSIPSVMLGEDLGVPLPKDMPIEWVANEKFGWC